MNFSAKKVDKPEDKKIRGFASRVRSDFVFEDTEEEKKE